MRGILFLKQGSFRDISEKNRKNMRKGESIGVYMCSYILAKSNNNKWRY